MGKAGVGQARHPRQTRPALRRNRHRHRRGNLGQRKTLGLRLPDPLARPAQGFQQPEARSAKALRHQPGRQLARRRPVAQGADQARAGGQIGDQARVGGSVQAKAAGFFQPPAQPVRGQREG